MMLKLKAYLIELKAELSYLKLNFGWLLSKKKKAIYIGCTGHGNLGDVCVMNAIKEMTKKQYFIYPILYTKPSSGKFLRNLFIKSVDLIILGGGTIIKKGKNEGYLRLLLKFHNLYPKADMKVLGSGVADPELSEAVGFPTDKQTWTSILNKCSYIGIRGNISKNYLNRWGVKQANVIHDPAIYFKRDRLKQKKSEKKIGINFCNIVGRIYGLDQKLVETFARDIVYELIKDKWEVWLYPTTLDDIDYILSIFDEKTQSQLNIYNNVEDLERSLDFMESLDIFLGQRLHSVVFSAITYTPFIAIEYESKTSDFLEVLGLREYSHRTDELNKDSIFKMLNFIYKDKKNIQKKLYDKISYAADYQNSEMLKIIN